MSTSHRHKVVFVNLSHLALFEHNRGCLFGWRSLLNLLGLLSLLKAMWVIQPLVQQLLLLLNLLVKFSNLLWIKTHSSIVLVLKLLLLILCHLLILHLLIHIRIWLLLMNLLLLRLCLGRYGLLKIVKRGLLLFLDYLLIIYLYFWSCLWRHHITFLRSKFFFLLVFFRGRNVLIV